VTAERGLLAALGGGCQVPIGAHATVVDERVHLIAIVASPDGAALIRGEADGDASDAEAIGRRLGADLLARGAKEILDAVDG
jgi:hydroxymethylbilane synthase